jgi:hypothetical protein
VKPHVANVYVGSGDEEIQFHNGSRILFGARERGFGRGFDDVDVEVFDEAQILTENAIDDMVPATNTAANPLLIFMGTPPKPSDPSEVFTTKRTTALSGDDEDTAYIEFSAERGCDPIGPQAVGQGKPERRSGRTPESAMLRMIKNLSVDSFVREGLGDLGRDRARGCDHSSSPTSGTGSRSTRLRRTVRRYGVKFSPDGTRSRSPPRSTRRRSGIHVEGIEHRPIIDGTRWLVEWLRAAMLERPSTARQGSGALDLGAPQSQRAREESSSADRRRGHHRARRHSSTPSVSVRYPTSRTERSQLRSHPPVDARSATAAVGDSRRSTTGT